MSKGYGNHPEYMERVRKGADARQQAVEVALREVFSDFIERRDVEVVAFSDITAIALADAILARPIVLKPLLASSNIAARAIERDLGMRNVDTYAPVLSPDQAKVIAGYIKPFLPSYAEIPSLTLIDRVGFIDKENR